MDEMALAVVATKQHQSWSIYGRMNIGSRPSKRKPNGGIESLPAIPWIFAWTQARFHLPVWLGFGAAFKQVIKKDIKNLHMLQEMYDVRPFFRVTIDLVEMVFAEGDPSVAALSDKTPCIRSIKAIWREIEEQL
ncbi:phosphoenolpyruvate carboxylase-like [Mangifera indica]|uniref:phosphoenolpyruvate carboxylase-like n=1 Tax=Mangifera indica TaxID=29780 RepID=UPI001CF9DD94|nr:phosphoenolpyruvate carboxylase-like [Mangifera indica]